MIQLIVSLIVGAVLLLSLHLLMARSPRAPGGGKAIVGARQALNNLQLDLLPAELVSRIFSREDFDYLASVASTATRRRFLRQRRRIALLWVAHLRGQIVSLRSFHLGRSRFYSELSLKAEMVLAFQFAQLLIVCRLLEVAIYLRGPYAVPWMVGATASVAGRVCAASETSLAFLSAAGVDTLREGSAKRQAVL